MQRYKPDKIFRPVGAPCRLPAGKGHVRGFIGMTQMVDARHHAGGEHLAVGHDAPTDMPPKPTP